MDFARASLEVYKQDCEIKIEEQNKPPPPDSFCLYECSFNGNVLNYCVYLELFSRAFYLSSLCLYVLAKL